MQMAEAAATLDHLHAGRFAIGIGSAGWVKDTRRAWGQAIDRSVARMREYVELMRLALSGDPVDYHGTFYDVNNQLDFAPGSRVPIYVAAGGPQLCRVAAQKADGVFIEGRRSRALEVLADTTWAAAREAGRDSAAVRIHRLTLVNVAETRDVSRDNLRRNLLDLALSGESQQLVLRAAG